MAARIVARDQPRSQTIYSDSQSARRGSVQIATSMPRSDVPLSVAATTPARQPAPVTDGTPRAQENSAPHPVVVFHVTPSNVGDIQNSPSDRSLANADSTPSSA